MIRYNIYGGNGDLKAVFSDVQRFLRWVPITYDYASLG